MKMRGLMLLWPAMAGLSVLPSAPEPGYGRRFASNFAIAGVSTTTRYALAKACITAVSAKASFRG